MEAKLKHLEFIQAAISRMATNSSLFRGWSITLAAALAAFAAVDSKPALLSIALVSTALFWGLDGYYLWLEHGFIALHKKVSGLPADEIDFNMSIDKSRAFRRWIRTLLRPHLVSFYFTIMAIDVIGIILMKGKK